METEQIPLTFERQTETQARARAPKYEDTMLSNDTDNTEASKDESKNQDLNNDNPQELVMKEKLIYAFRLNRKKQLTLERINKYNQKLMEELKAPRIKASNCALMVINYTEQTNDPLIPQIWGNPPINPYNQRNNKGQTVNNSAGGNIEVNTCDQAPDNGGCCAIM